MLFMGAGLIVIVAMIIIVLFNNNKSAKEPETTAKVISEQDVESVSKDNGHKKVGINRELKEEETNYEKEISEMMEYVTIKYGYAYTFESYKKNDDGSDSVYIISEDKTEKICVTRVLLNGNYIYEEQKIDKE